MKRILLLTVTLLLFSPACFAEDIYIAQSTLGSDSGVDCGNAHNASWFNNEANWGDGAVKISAGDTVHLCGGISTALTVQGSGSSSQKITIRFESGAKLSAAHWGSSGAINGADKQYIIIDGGTNGRIECTSNGTSGSYSNPSIGVNLNRCNGWEIKNLVISNIYARTPNSSDSNRGSRSLQINDSDNVSVHSCTLSGAEYILRIMNQSKPSDSIRVYDNRLTDFATGIVVAADGNSDLTNVTLYNNEFIGSNTWDGKWGPTSISWHHRDGIHTWTGGGATGTCYVDFYNNYIHGDFGDETTQTAFIYYSSSTIGNIYNNLIVPSGGVPPHGFVYLAMGDGETLRVQVLNNTFISLGPRAAGKYAISMYGRDVPNNLKVYNNAFINFYYAYYDMYGTDLRAAKWDNNCYYNMTVFAVVGNTVYDTFSAWKSYLGGGTDREGSSKWANPLLQINYRPRSDSPLIDAGKNLQGIFLSDKDGVPRPQGSAWDIGAYEYQNFPPPNPPTNLTIVQ
jgi:hypothetical protein